MRILDEGLAAAVRLSHRYLPDRQLPDKAVSVLDTACARLALGQNATPPAIEDAMRTLDDLAVQTRVLERESALGADHRERLAQIARTAPETEGRLTALRERWEKEKDLVDAHPRNAVASSKADGRAARSRPQATARPRLPQPAVDRRSAARRNWPS